MSHGVLRSFYTAPTHDKKACGNSIKTVIVPEIGGSDQSNSFSWNERVLQEINEIFNSRWVSRPTFNSNYRRCSSWLPWFGRRYQWRFETPPSAVMVVVAVWKLSLIRLKITSWCASWENNSSNHPSCYHQGPSKMVVKIQTVWKPNVKITTHVQDMLTSVGGMKYRFDDLRTFGTF